MKPLAALLMICSLGASGCGVPRPDTDLCVVNAEANHLICFNMLHDYDKNGKLKKDAQPKFKPANTVQDLNKNICTDPDGFANLKAYMKKLQRLTK